MYDIMMDGISVGQATVEKEGLYYCFACTCIPQKEGVHRIHVCDGENVRDLGICVPDGNVFRLSTRIPVKYFCDGNWSFVLSDTPRIEKVVPVKEDEPFSYLEQLNTARLQNTNGQPEIILPTVQDQPDSGLSQEYPNKWVQP